MCVSIRCCISHNCLNIPMYTVMNKSIGINQIFLQNPLYVPIQFPKGI